MAHVIEGVRILREGGIPEPVVEFVYTHHGTSVIEYFWHKCLKQGNPKGLTEASFRYPGMTPHTKETAILMLIDSIEAGARTVDPPTREAFEQLVQRAIFTKLRQGQLDDSGLTLEDLNVLSNQIAETLVQARHNRVRYPWQETEGSEVTMTGSHAAQSPAGNGHERVSPAAAGEGAGGEAEGRDTNTARADARAVPTPEAARRARCVPHGRSRSRRRIPPRSSGSNCVPAQRWISVDGDLVRAAPCDRRGRWSSRRRCRRPR